MLAFTSAAFTCCCNTDEANVVGSDIIDDIKWAVNICVSWFSCKAEAGTCMVSTRDSEFMVPGWAGKVI